MPVEPCTTVYHQYICDADAKVSNKLTDEGETPRK